MGAESYQETNPETPCLSVSMGKLGYSELVTTLGKCPEIPFLSRDYWEPRWVDLGQGMTDRQTSLAGRVARACCGKRTTGSEL